MSPISNNNNWSTIFVHRNVASFETAKNNSVTLKNSTNDFWRKENVEYSQKPKSGFESQEDKSDCYKNK